MHILVELLKIDRQIYIRFHRYLIEFERLIQACIDAFKKSDEYYAAAFKKVYEPGDAAAKMFVFV